MFIIKYHAKGKKPEYFNGSGRVKTKSAAMAFGEGLREKFQSLEQAGNNCYLVTIPVSEIAEIMYNNECIKVSRIAW